MKKIIYISIFLSYVLLISCKSSLHTISKSNNLEDCVKIIVNGINECYEGSNQLEVDNKAEFEFRSKYLKVYIGKSSENYVQKWEIPLNELDEKTVIIDTTTLKSFQVFTLGKKNRIRYFENNGAESDFINQYNYYLPDYCYNEKEKRKFIEAFKRAIILSKL